jgi:hypothetical protein
MTARRGSNSQTVSAQLKLLSPKARADTFHRTSSRGKVAPMLSAIAVEIEADARVRYPRRGRPPRLGRPGKLRSYVDRGHVFAIPD